MCSVHTNMLRLHIHVPYLEMDNMSYYCTLFLLQKLYQYIGACLNPVTVLKKLIPYLSRGFPFPKFHSNPLCSRLVALGWPSPMSAPVDPISVAPMDIAMVWCPCCETSMRRHGMWIRVEENARVPLPCNLVTCIAWCHELEFAFCHDIRL